jgi:hypothetical protein
MMRFCSGMLLLLACGASCGCNRNEPAPPPPIGGSAQREAAATANEVIVLATQHFISDMPDGYTPGHLRALLTKIKPDVIAVEAPTNAPDPWPLAPYDCWKITKPWADEQQIPIVPVGWLQPAYQTELMAMFQTYQQQGKAGEYQQVEQAFQLAGAQQPATCAFMNSSAYQDVWRTYHQKLHDLYGRETPWEAWNAKIVANVEQACRERPGKRLAVVFGGAHGYYLADRLRESDHIKVVDAESFFPLSDADVADQTTTSDYLQSLRPLNFPAVAPQQLPRLAAALDKIKQVPEYVGDYHLFHGKLLLHEGKFAEAEDEFAKLADGSNGVLAFDVLAFDGQSRLRESGRVYAAIAKSRQGKVGEARADFDAVLSLPETTAATRQWIEQLKLELPAEGQGASPQASADALAE